MYGKIGPMADLMSIRIIHLGTARHSTQHKAHGTKQNGTQHTVRGTKQNDSSSAKSVWCPNPRVAAPNM